MRRRTLAIAAAAFLAFPVAATSQVLEFGPGGIRIGPGGRAGRCEELRRACENKDEIGEEGLGNCRRYREACQPRRRPNCEELRLACENKDDLGEEGRGNCRRYRELCRR